MASGVEILAREMKFLIQDPDSGDFLEIENIDSVGHTPTTTRADTGSFSKAGRAAGLPAERGDAFNLTIKSVIDKATGKEPPGNELLREAGSKIGHAAIYTYRYVGPTGYGIEFEADAEVGHPAGARNDQAAYSVTITVNGAPRVVEPGDDDASDDDTI